ncbi:hypothetical protein [Cohnella thailandensis]|uniref:Lipoprotein n=1 Tax=Cohnella thailandensis TaxID=557557 RepID=A0A841T5F8_9BACL|nr:hypothetical protein [Cohnella thailandensis]MBB6637538.1 hypothetical protein [Cohnella thailandensis]MBP1977571.1 hypothetical protein [Cohnella thailandensis]
MMRSNTGSKIVPVLAFALTLVACTDGNKPSATSAVPVQSPDTSSAAPSPDAGSTSTAAPSAVPFSSPEESPAPQRPQTESFDLMTEEGYKPRTATLHHGEGFSFYVFEGFTFESSSGRLELTENPEYFVDMEQLPMDYDLTALSKEGEESLKKFGAVSDHSGELVEHPLGYAELYLQAVSGEGISDYIVWKSETGDPYLFRIRNPKGEQASAFASPVLVSLSTVM